MNLGYFEVDPEVQANMRHAADVLRDLGCEVDEVDVGFNWGVQDCWMTWWEGLFAGIAGHLLPRWQYEMDPFVVRLLEKGMTHSAARLYQCQVFRGWMWEQLQPILKRYNFLICPTLAVPSVKAEQNDADPNFQINGVRVMAYVGWICTNPFNLLSQCPVMSVPTGFSSFGVPTGMQVVGRPYDDHSVFRAAAAFEGATQPWQSTRPSI